MINDGVLTLKQACSGRYSGMSKLSSRRFEHTQNRSTPFLIFFSIALEINGLGWCHAVIHAKFGMKTECIHCTRSFSPGYTNASMGTSN